MEKLHLYRIDQSITAQDFEANCHQRSYIPLKTRRAAVAPGHQRWKKENFSAEIYPAWNEKGLYLAFNIRDRQVHNNAAPERFWSEDCLEFFLDLRSEQSRDYSGNSTHLFIAPPQGSNNSRFFVINNRFARKDFFCQTFLTASGWGGNIFVPWDAFPGFKAQEGSELGLGFQVCDDYGRPDGNPFFAAQYMRFGSDLVPLDPQTLPRWVLSSGFTPSPENDLSGAAAVDLPRLLFTKSVNADIIIAEAFQKEVASIDWQCTIAGCKLSGTLQTLDKLSFELPEDIVGDGLLKLTFRNARKQIAGVMNLPFRRINGEKLQRLQQQVIELIKTADLPSMAAQTPEKVHAYFGLLNNHEQLKRLIFLEKIEELEPLATEMSLRIQQLQNQKLQTDDPLFKLLALAADQHGQISVEFPRYQPSKQRRNDALIKFYCASIPLARVRVTAAEASDTWQRKQVPALYYREIMPSENKDDLLFYFTVGSSHHKLTFIPPEALQAINSPDAAVIAANAPLHHRKALQIYARQHNIPLLSEDSLAVGMTVLYAGRPAPGTVTGKLLAKAYRFYYTANDQEDIVLNLHNGYKAQIRCIAGAGRELIAEVLSANRPFTAQDSAKLTGLVAGELARRGIKEVDIPENCELMAADVHCHSIYSDGFLTPLGLIAAAIYSRMDFLMISDHETAEGVLLTQKELQKYRFAFPLLAGEENSLPDGHFNSYPLTSSIPCNLSFSELLKTAHKQGALVQYNHPGSYSNRRDLQLNGIKNSGLEAWEHELPPYARQWSEQPALIGSSDNHNSAFPTERTITYASQMDGSVFKEAVRNKRTGIIKAESANFVYGPENLQGMLLKALREPEKYLLKPHFRRMQKFLHNSDIPGLFADIPGATAVEMDQ